MAHLILVCKYRKPLLSKLGDYVKLLIYEIAEEHNFGISEVECDKDHIHILVEYAPSQSILSIVRLLKQVTTYRIWRQPGVRKQLKRELWAERTFWSDGYFACSVGQVGKDAIRKYIQTQG